MRNDWKIRILGLVISLLAFQTMAFSEEVSGVLFREDFKNWRDNSTDPGFNTRVRSAGNKLTISTLDVEYGKTMSKSEPITINFTKQTEVTVDIERIDAGATATISLMGAYEPYDTFQIARVEGKAGQYKVNVNKLSGWQGVSSIWIVIWMEGKNKSVTIKDISFQDEAIKAVRRKEAALKSYMAKSFAPAPSNSVFYEDFRNGISGWRTAETDPSFFSEVNFEEGVPRLKFIQNKGYCKLMSPTQGIQADITSNTAIQICVGDMGTSRVKVDVMTAQPPFDNHTAITWIKSPGVYTVNLSEKTKWFGGKNFWIAIWLETTQNAAAEHGAVIKYIRVFENTEE